MTGQQPQAAGPYDGMTDEDVLARAARALRRVDALLPGSVERSIQWSVYDSAKAELDRRFVRHVLDAIDGEEGPR
jgi:hypothetical protein